MEEKTVLFVGCASAALERALC